MTAQSFYEHMTFQTQAITENDVWMDISNIY